MPQIICLPRDLDAAAATRLLADIRALRGTAVTLDARNTRMIGALCAQILAAARTAWNSDDVSFKVRGFESIVRDLSLLGFSDVGGALDIRQCP